MDDRDFGRALVERGLLTEQELDAAVQERKRIESEGRPAPFIWDVLIQKGSLSRMQVDEILASMQRRFRFCQTCNASVTVPRVTHEGERCNRCGGPVGWRSTARARRRS